MTPAHVQDLICSDATSLVSSVFPWTLEETKKVVWNVTSGAKTCQNALVWRMIKAWNQRTCGTDGSNPTVGGRRGKRCPRHRVKIMTVLASWVSPVQDWFTVLSLPGLHCPQAGGLGAQERHCICSHPVRKEFLTGKSQKCQWK